MLTKAARDEIRARTVRCDKLADLIGGRMMGAESRFEMLTLLDDLDAQDAELARIGADKAYLFQANVANEWEERYECQERRIELMNAEIQRLTADNDRLTVIALADEWQARYWAEHNAVADRDATIMAERAQSAAMRQALERHVEICGQSGSHRAANVLLSAEAALQSDAGKTLLDAHAAELKEERELRHISERKRTQQGQALAEKLSELAALRQRAEHWEKSFCEALKRAEAAEANLIEARKTAEGHREPCYYCGKPVNNLAANPGLWSVGLCHGDDPGRLKWHHVSCVSERLARREAAETRATCDGSTERAHAESTKAAIAALWETNPEIAYESPAQVIGWLKGRAEAAELFRATFERPHGLRSGQCCDPVIDGEICALLLRVAAAEATVEAVKVEISGDANFGRIVELLFYGPLREKEEELRIAHGKIAELEGELAERALGGEGK